MSVRVQAMKWLEPVAKEALLSLTDGRNEVVVFCHPCEVYEGDEIEGRLYTLAARDMVRANGSLTPYIKSLESGLAAEVLGSVLSPEAKLVQYGAFTIELDVPMPGDIEAGEMITFVCDRIDADGVKTT